MAENEDFIGRIAITILPGMSGAPDEHVEGRISTVYWKVWDEKSELGPFDPYERVIIDLTVPGSDKTRPVDVALTDVTIVEE